MFNELTEELLDLAVHESGYRNAVGRVDWDSGCYCSGSSSSLTCCPKSRWSSALRMRPRREARRGR